MSEEGQLKINAADKDFIVNIEQPTYVKNTTATLLDNGNLVLRSPRGRTLWQSFDYPTNNWVQGMKLGWFGLKTPRPHQRFLTSWTSHQNPSPGAFTFGVLYPNNTKPPQLVLMRRGIVYWQNGVWNGKYFPFLRDSPGVYNFSYFSDDNERYFILNNQVVDDISSNILIYASGEVSVITDNYRESSMFTAIDCYNNKRADSDTEGCVRVKKSNCGSVGDNGWFNSTTGFIEQWEQYLYNFTFGITDCNQMCAQNCSCNAYASIIAEAGTGCKFSSSPAYNYSFDGDALYIRHNAKPAALTVSFLVILAVVFIVWYINPRKCCRTCFLAPTEHSRQQLAGKEDEDLPFFNFKTIETATNSFSNENKLGGGFGPVYKGILPNGQEIATKRLSKMSGQGIEQFKNEVLLISKLQHRNLVRLLGCCTHGDERILIYEYLPNKSLDSILFDERKKDCLDWRKRISIIDGIAQGLLYLHKYSRMRIIHRDLKTSNILLDIHMHPKISDFGTARIFKDNVYQASTKSIIGTYSYMSPEYAMNGCFSEKSNVFSFGVMVLEIAWDVWIEGRILDLIDPALDKPVSINEATRCIQIGLLCVQDSAADRPTMSDVISVLGNESTVLPTPKQPGFSTVIGLKCDDVGNNPKVHSANMVTISDIEEMSSRVSVVGIGAFFFICHAGLICHVNAKDTFAPGDMEWHYAGNNLESSNGQYMLKFIQQPAGGSTFSWYLCIQSAWYYSRLPPENITIWVAWKGQEQRDNDSPPYLSMSEEGQLIIYAAAGKGFIVNIQQPSYVKKTSATLLDNGNLVFRSPGGRTLWQSFDYPTHTWVQGMKLGWFGLKTPQPHQRFLTSWTNQQNPSPGAFTFGVHYPNNNTNTKPPQLVLMRRGVVYWQSGVWNGNNFPFLPYLNFTYFSDENQSYFILNNDQDDLAYYTLIIHAIGEVSVETNGYNRSVFDCYNKEWADSNAAGCIRVKISNCSVGDNDWFNSTTGFIDEWEQYLYNFTFGITDCEELCAKNCSCNAYASINAEAGTGSKFSSSPAYRFASDGEALYIRHNAKPVNSPATQALTKTKSHHNKTATIAALTVTFLVILAMIFIVWYMNPRKCCCSCFIALSFVTAPNEHSRQQPAGKEDEDLPFFNFKSIEMATNYFSTENKLGQEGFGPVYKGILPNGQEIAAKRLSKMSGQGIEQFKNEVLLISKLQHRNLVRLLGCCTHGDERILIYEYLPNKSLDSILFDERKKDCLDWRKRVSIIDGIAQGLLYLHKYSRMRIIHRNLKTSNILLDIHMHPKISDFGTARIFKDNVYQASTKSIIGTYGYMSPEYAMNGCFSEKSDVFSFGVMVMEIVSGKRNNDFYNPHHVSNLLSYAWDVWREGRISELIDPTMDKTVSLNEAIRCIQVGLLCVQDSVTDRPVMSDVVSMLGNELMVLPTPKQPGFSTIIGLRCDDVVNNSKVGSINMVTISDIEGR
ncbi:G-type lectin S-receptor-like serine/threonine-protein kinase CES101 [Ipomoea triloba]|uniref:G-type lectin S-receptor-like serine/threonine-protein kinase CES101 n=1 Tax=Ipomoea triloba TaxID=35885 RepID=UPI00125CEF23|nr:G-type lectin S-receptor-like serine/threonine-protein kinase CES101 [Ipomoea triloba]